MVVDTPEASTAPVQPPKTSLNEPSYAGMPSGAADLAPAVAAETGGSVAGATPGLRRAPRESGEKYTLINPPSYDGIIGGQRPSPFVSIILLIGLLALVGAAIASGLGIPVEEWWMFGLLFVVVSTTLAGFISRSA